MCAAAVGFGCLATKIKARTRSAIETKYVSPDLIRYQQLQARKRRSLAGPMCNNKYYNNNIFSPLKNKNQVTKRTAEKKQSAKSCCN